MHEGPHYHKGDSPCHVRVAGGALCGDNGDISSGQAHYERRIAQQRAADKRRVKRREDYNWKKEHDGS